LEAFCKPVFSFIQLNKNSIGCLTLEKAIENRSSAAFLTGPPARLSLVLSLAFYEPNWGKDVSIRIGGPKSSLS
jgi:hypothetical protein